MHDNVYEKICNSILNDQEYKSLIKEKVRLMNSLPYIYPTEPIVDDRLIHIDECISKLTSSIKDYYLSRP